MKIKYTTLTFMFIMAFISGHANTGEYCGSNASLAGRIYKQTSSDFWPSLDLSDVVLLHLGVDLTIPKTTCGVLHGQADFGPACKRHDQCYDGIVSPGYTREQCDEQIHNEWIQACYGKYSHSWWDEGKNKCQDFCRSTADVMYSILKDMSLDAWNEARSEREANVAKATNENDDDDLLLSIPLMLSVLQSK
ncbi:exported hypothetical protein [Gammaproteobacteria bacterium]